MALLTNAYGPLRLVQSTLLLALGVPHGFTTRPGGVSTGGLASLNLGTRRGDEPERVQENYRRLTAALGLDWQGVVFSPQVHGTTVRVVERMPAPRVRLAPEETAADACVTDVPGVTPVIFTADCTPILLYDPRHRAAAAVHAGWRGTAAGTLPAAIQTMRRAYGTRPEDLIAAIGPAICSHCFECGMEVAQAMRDRFGPEAEPYLHCQDGKCHPNLKALNRLHLLRAGVPGGQIDLSDQCTRETPELYWSHRRDGDARGSQAALISPPVRE